MVCTQCGHDNPLSAKFCNECGALVDRRKQERRQGDRRKASASHRPSVMPSLTPGQENAQGHSPAVRAAETYLRRERPLRGPEQMPVEEPRERGAPMSRPALSGPSFLGLGGGSPGSGDYLLEDEPRSSWRAWAVLLLLVLIGVLAYMQWKTNWRAQPTTAPPSLNAPSQSGPQGSNAPASEATGVPAAAPQQAAAQQPGPGSQLPANDPAAAPAPDKPKSDDSTAKEPASDKLKEPASDKNAKEPASDKSDAAAEDQSDQSEEQAPAEPAPKPAARTRKKPAAERSTATAESPDPMVLMARKYLYGEGVRRDCDQAMVYLRAANQRANAAARSQMGALYATGYCVPLDRVRAYQWFTSALNVEPGNPSLQRERNNLWSQMSSNERQQAVK